MKLQIFRPKSSLITESGMTYLSQSLASFLNMLTVIILARLVGASGFGVYNLATALFGFMVIIGNLGIQNSYVYNLGRKKFKQEELFGFLIAISIGFGILTVGIFFILFILFKSQFLNIFGEEKYNGYIFAMMLFIPLGIARLHIKYFFLGLKDIKRFNFLSICDTVFCTLLVIILVLVIKLDVRGALLAWTLSICFSFLVHLILLLKKVTPKFGINLSIFKVALRYGFLAFTCGIMQLVNLRLDLFLVGYFLTVKDVGYYAIAVGLSNFVLRTSKSVCTVLFPRYSSLDDQKSNKLTATVVRNSVFLLSTLSITMVFFGKPLIHLFYGKEYIPSYKPFLILLPGVIALTITHLVYGNFMGKGIPKMGIYAFFSSLLFTVTLDFLLIPLWGIAGAAVASSISYGIGALVISQKYTAESDETFADLLIIKKSDFLIYKNILTRSLKAKNEAKV